MTATAEGQIYTTGWFTGTQNFNPDGQDEKTSLGVDSGENIGRNGYLTKWNTDGTYGWTKIFGGTVTQIAPIEVDVGPDGSIYISGNFWGTANFNPDGTDIKSAVSSDISKSSIFVTKLNTDESYAWTKVQGSVDDYQLLAAGGDAVDIDNDGNIYLASSYGGTTNLNSDGSDEYTAPVSERRAYVTSWSSSGTYRWSNMLDGDSINMSLAVDSVGHVIVAGAIYENGSVNLDPEINNPVQGLASYVLSYNPGGSFRWAKSFAAGSSYPFAVNVDSDDNIYISGNFGGMVNFNPDGTDYLINPTNQITSYLSVWSKNAEYEWTRAFSNGTNGINQIQNIDIDSMGNIYAVGLFYGQVRFNPGSSETPIVATAPIENSGGVGAFITKFNPNGSVDWLNSYAQENTAIWLRYISAKYPGKLYAYGSLLAAEPGIDLDLGPNEDMRSSSNGKAALIALDTDTYIYGAYKTFKTASCKDPDPPVSPNTTPTTPPPTTRTTPITPITPGSSGGNPAAPSNDNSQKQYDTPLAQPTKAANSRREPSRTMKYAPFAFMSWLLLLALMYAYRALKEYRQQREIAELVAQQKDTAKGIAEFIDITMHYFNTPLAILKGSLELLVSKGAVKPTDLKAFQTEIISLTGAVEHIMTDNQQVLKGQTSQIGIVEDLTRKNWQLWFSCVLSAVGVAVIDIYLQLSNSYTKSGWRVLSHILLLGGLIILAVLLSYFLTKQRAIRKQQARLLEKTKQLLEQKSKLFVTAYTQLSAQRDKLKIAAKPLLNSVDSKLISNGMQMLDQVITSLGKTVQVAGYANDAEPIQLVSYFTEKIAPVVAKKLSAKQINFANDIAPSVHIQLIAPEVDQLIGSLLDNAIDFSPNEGKVMVRARRSVRGVVISVSDTGPGMTNEYKSHAFQPLRRGVDTEAFNHPGLGMNLFVNKLIVEKHGGSIDIKGNKGEGLTIELRLPNPRQTI
jgi:signal transduction histidine kinase